MNNFETLQYLQQYKNPLDKKYRWEVNTAFKDGKITDKQRVNLLKVKDAELEGIIQCIAQKIPVDKAQVGNYYYKRALYLFRQRKRFASTVKINLEAEFAYSNDLTGQGLTKPANFSK